jgi:hypothetical protein
LFDIVFPAVFQSWLDALAVISLDMYTFVGIACVASINLYSEFAITVSVPVVGLLSILLCHRGRLWYIRRSMVTATDIVEKDTEQGQTPGSDDDEQHALVASKLWDWAVWRAIGWLFLVYTILCRTTFRSFACQEIDEGESFHQVGRCTRERL